MADEAGGIQEGLRRVYGEAVLERFKACEFHYLQCANRQRARLHRDKSAILGVDTSSNTLQQAALTAQEVCNIFDNAPLPPPLSPSPPTRSNQGQQWRVQSSTCLSDAESRASKVIEKVHRCQLPQVWRLEKYHIIE